MPVGSARVSRRGRLPDAIPDSAIHHWQLNEGTESTANDDIGNIDGSIIGASWTSDADAVGGWKLDFDGIGDEIDFGSNFINPISNQNPFTIAFTVENLSYENAVFLYYHNTSADERFFIGIDDSSNLSFRYFATDEWFSITDAPSGRFRLAVSFDGSNNITPYINASETSQTSVNAFDNTGLEGHRFATRSDSQQHADFIGDDIIVYNEELGPNELENDYNRQPWS